MKKREQLHAGIIELDHFFLSPEDNAISILSFGENACDERGRMEFAVLETKRSIEVAEIRRFFEALQENQHRNFREQQEAIEPLSATQSKLLATIERKQKLMTEASDEIQRKVLQDVLALEDKFSAVETELHEASAEMRRLTVERKRAGVVGLRVSDTSKGVLSKATIMKME